MREAFLVKNPATSQKEIYRRSYQIWLYILSCLFAHSFAYILIKDLSNITSSVVK